jgi:putative FmdB family regulatory protein
MPIYEYYCRDCHTIYSFLARSRETPGAPQCPKCGRAKLEKQISRFAISKGLKESDSAPDPLSGMDESRMERAMMEMAGDIENLSDEDPRQMAQVMRRLFDATGMEPTDSIREAMRRLESGEDPDKIDEEMGGVLDSEDPFSLMAGEGTAKQKIRRLVEPPNVDPDLYDL